jgi:hypothetical protein
MIVPDKFALQESSGRNDIRGETCSVATRSSGRFPGSKGNARKQEAPDDALWSCGNKGQIKAVALHDCHDDSQIRPSAVARVRQLRVAVNLAPAAKLLSH